MTKSEVGAAVDSVMLTIIVEAMVSIGVEIGGVLIVLNERDILSTVDAIESVLVVTGTLNCPSTDEIESVVSSVEIVEDKKVEELPEKVLSTLLVVSMLISGSMVDVVFRETEEKIVEDSLFFVVVYEDESDTILSVEIAVVSSGT